MSKNNPSQRKKLKLKKLVKLKAKVEEEVDTSNITPCSYEWIYKFYLSLMVPLFIFFVLLWIMGC